VPGYLQVRRENQKTMVPVTAQLSGRDLGSANAEVQARVASEVELPPGYSVQYGGLYRTQQESFRALLTVLLFGTALVFTVLVCQYRGYLEAVILLGCGACSLTGAILATYVTGGVFNASSFTGTIMILGMSLTNGIYLMDMVRLRLASPGVSVEDAVMQAGQLRLRPVLMTAAIAVLTLLPLAFGVGAGAEMQKPLAIACIGGFVLSPLFALVLAPTLLCHLWRRSEEHS